MSSTDSTFDKKTITTKTKVKRKLGYSEVLIMEVTFNRKDNQYIN